MQASEWFQNLLEIGTKIDSLWSMYIGVHLAIFWFVFFIHRPLLWVERLIALFAYSFFAYVNGNALSNSYVLLEAMRRDLLGAFGAQIGQLDHVYALMRMADYSERPELIVVSHGFAWVLVALTLGFRNSMIQAYKRRYPDYAPHANAG